MDKHLNIGTPTAYGTSTFSVVDELYSFQ